MIKWGILGCGNIANKFADAVNKAVDGAELLACSARDMSRAQSFANKHKIPKHYGSYLELVQNPDIDVVYIATPHSHHKDQTLLCLEHGKAVICEKPMAINDDEVSNMISAAEKKNLFLMEALWMRFLPVMTRLRTVIAGGTLGELKTITADFSFKAKYIKEGRLFNPQLAGGALLDVGIYPLAFSLMVSGEAPVSYSGEAKTGETGVDVSNTFKLEFENGSFAVCQSSVVEQGSHEARVVFENGVVEIPNFWRAETMKVTRGSAETEEIKLPFDSNGFEYEIREAVDCLNEGKTESSTMPLSETTRIVKIMDGLRKSWNLTYPMEQKVSK